LRNGFLRVVDALTDSVNASLAQTSQTDEENIHRVRTTIKRLRALLRLIRPAVDPAFFDRENARLRSAAGRLSFARDTEVARGTLKSLPVSTQTDRKAVRSVLASFESRSETPANLDRSIAEVRRRLELTRRNLHRLRFRRPDPDILEAGLRVVYQQGRKRMKAAIKQGRDSAFHRWRIRAKNLYYELEFLESVWPKRLHRLVSQLSKLQDKIGLDHDIAVLRAWLKEKPAAFGGSETVLPVVSRLDSQTQKLRKRAVPLGRKIWRDKPRRFARQVVRHWRKR
jgi:CHAD domain-containing protein